MVFFRILFVATFLGVLFSSCREEEIPEFKLGSMTFEVSPKNAGSAQLRERDVSLSLVTSLVIGIKNSSQVSEFIVQDTIMVEWWGDAMVVPHLELAPGNYEIDHFLLLDGEDNVVFATPRKGSATVKRVDMPLPIPFQIGNGENKSMTMEVISSIGLSPEDLGLSAGEEGFEPEFHIFISVIQRMVDDHKDYLVANLAIRWEEGEKQVSLDGPITRVSLPRTQRVFEFEILVEGFVDFSRQFRMDSLLQYQKHPLLIPVTKFGEDCSGGSHFGNVILQSQQDVEEFGANCFDQIFGSLQIGIPSQVSADPIIDLSALESIEAVGSLYVYNNPHLINLKGLQYVKKIHTNLYIEDNPQLESLAQLWRIEEVANLSVINCPLVPGIADLENLGGEILNLKLENLPSLKKFTLPKKVEKLDALSLVSIPNLMELDLPYVDISEMGMVELKGTPKLMSLKGFHNKIKTLKILRIRGADHLKNVQEMFANGGVLTNLLELKGNTSLYSLNGFKLPRFMNGHILLENNEKLNELSAFSDLEMLTQHLHIHNNPSLQSLNGLEKLMQMGYTNSEWPEKRIWIEGNSNLHDFCALTHLFNENPPSSYQFVGNAFNPTSQQLKDGLCTE
ncbi:receptor L domain-containing protein [Pleomorphovibrio marinus]|uniref:hypothetical protein n=1 Tax=Pleomorphovibrio marinus TaxID=2164132 RepID=UPI000E0AFFAC|nr:hypothetical protein [Pleomorphovibrio marinus]